ncbi:DNA internalization-related competence protein ComEC/Rec2 [Psychrobacillus lasiicapitis]|uniref:DNA internalization-related competence protein ComEC/Rec2 n=2 Tax=Psychrobacillus lasiicapitis TaxID=1636719 RepID=A0A544TAX3_9BACI|nr:DNA internalization-related competence protein ComEC/Rec2 [Psychrobacillus lasiicapitis]GGA32622.1 DNA internalization-related competence protein ComEC/Rec2 [Psychrobacillus lasiicapitis]
MQASEIHVKEITWTDVYRINGQYIRGFAISEDGEKWYVQLKLGTETEKAALMQTSIAGMVFQVIAEEVEKRPASHAYAFNMDSYIKSNGAVGQMAVEKYQIIEKNESFLAYMAEKRFAMKSHIQNTFPSSLQSEAEALLIGSREQMPSDIKDAYQTLGITHLFAISGLHVALLALMVYEALIRIGIRRETANLVLLIALPLYAFIAGGAPSVWRSVSVTEVVLLSLLFKKKLAIDDAFSLSVIGFVLLTPWVIFQIGFQLSYLAAFSLIYSSVFLKNSTSYVMQSFVITALCQLIVYPILLYQFYEISISSFLANLFFVPLFSFIILPINLFFLILTYISTSASDFLFHLYEPVRRLLGEFIIYLGSLPYQIWNPMKPSLLLVFLAYGTVLFFFISIERKKQLVFCSFLLLLPMGIMQVTPYLDSSTKITFLNVGQGDCIVIEMPYRKEIIMIDTGGVLRFEQDAWKKTNEDYEVGRQIVVPFLKGKGINKLDTLVLTHADADHMEGAEEILQEVHVDEIHITPGSTNKNGMRDLMEEVRKQQIPMIEKVAGEKIDSSYFQFQYIYPWDATYEGNNDSLVLSMQNRYFHGLFMGDVEKEGELELVSRYPEALKDITLLKIGHHGSKTSSEQSFLELTDPAVSIITAGFGNRFGHPHQEVVDRLDELQIPFFQTGREGTIEVEITKGGELLVTTPQ